MIVDTNHDALSVLSCSFCGKSAKEAHLVIGPCVTICEDCIDMAAGIVEGLSGRPVEAVAEATWRTLLARDVAEVERAILVFAKTAKLHEEAIVLDEETEAKYPANRTSGAQNAHRLDVLIWHATAHRSRVCIDDCQAWLTRARAALA